MKKSNFALRLQPSLMKGLKKAAAEDDTTLNQYINIAIAEKLSARATAEEFFASRAYKADRTKALRLLRKLGKDDTPQQGDETPTA